MIVLSTLSKHALRHAARLRTRDHQGEHTENLCNALETLASHAATYDLLCTGSPEFAEHFTSLIIQEAISEDDELALLEDALLFIREKTLRTTRHKASPIECALLDWAENGTLWKPADGTLFSSQYYYELPLAIVKNVMRHVGNPQLESRR